MPRVRIILVFYLFAIPFFLNAQSVPEIGQYIWKESILMQPSSVNGACIKDGTNCISEIPSEKGQKFKVLRIIANNDSVIIKILDYTQSVKKKTIPKPKFYTYNYTGDSTEFSSLSNTEKTSFDLGTGQLYFRVHIDYVVKYAFQETRFGGALSIGVINFPFKARNLSSNGDFSGAFNFGTAVGYKFPHRNWHDFHWSIVAGFSLSDVVLDNGSVKQNADKLATVNNFSALSLSIGPMLEFKKVQVGIFLGWDWIKKINHQEFGWNYQGRPWLSIGIGYSVFSNEKEKEMKDESQRDKSN